MEAPQAKDECVEQPKEIPFWINCKKEGHVASYKGYEMYPKPKERKPTRLVDPNFSYADMAKNRLNQNKLTGIPEINTPKITPSTLILSLRFKISSLFSKNLNVYSKTNIALSAHASRSQTNDIDKTNTLLNWLSATHPLPNK
ncbi:hypothetical protein AVEN_5908-1 [Araneus ventricosus]|uniref:Uncharacterized protein n=1 Tax=Araneus ventricosus TaxID=182803 RepID=A0A4Y2IF59_ARAVE|nr:hypothetical protein AVEN_5908-1 [Araneus ventricosus]